MFQIKRQPLYFLQSDRRSGTTTVSSADRQFFLKTVVRRCDCAKSVVEHPSDIRGETLHTISKRQALPKGSISCVSLLGFYFLRRKGPKSHPTVFLGIRVLHSADDVPGHLRVSLASMLRVVHAEFLSGRRHKEADTGDRQRKRIRRV